MTYEGDIEILDRHYSFEVEIDDLECWDLVAVEDDHGNEASEHIYDCVRDHCAEKVSEWLFESEMSAAEAENDRLIDEAMEVDR